MEFRRCYVVESIRREELRGDGVHLHVKIMGSIPRARCNDWFAIERVRAHDGDQELGFLCERVEIMLVQLSDLDSWKRGRDRSVL